MAVLLLGLLPGCGGGSTVHPASPGFNLSVPALVLAKSSVGTVSVQINRTGGFQGAVTLSVASALPKGIKASFAPSDGTGSSLELSVQAGYPDPADPTFQTFVDPVVGPANLVIQGTSGTITSTAAFNLTVTAGTPGDFALSLVMMDTATNTGTLYQDSDLIVHTGVPTKVTIIPYGLSDVDPWAGSMPGSTYVTLGATGLPKGLTVAMPTGAVPLDTAQTLTLNADSSLAAGTYGFSLSASTGSTVRYLPMVVNVAPGLFWEIPPASVTLAQGQSLTLPVKLGRDDLFFQANGGTDPDYMGTVSLGASSGNLALTAAFPNPNPSRFASAPLVLTAGAGLPVGPATVTLTATRTGSPSGTAAATLSQTFTVNVTASASTATTWIQKAEWGQTILSENLTLIPGKPALLRVHLLADRTGVAAPVVTATVQNAAGATVDTVTLQGPAAIPTTVDEGILAETFTATLPAADIASGMKVALTAGPATLTLTPVVETKSLTLDLKLVPVIHKGLEPTLPADADLRQALLAHWPIGDVAISHRAPYTTATVVPMPQKGGGTGDHSSDGWAELLTEMAALKVIDNSPSSYYGIFNADLASLAVGVSSTVGLHYVGYGAGLGIDTTTATFFGGTKVCIATAVHELGHGFNLNHAPVGGAGSPQMNYPYQGGAIGTFGFDPYTGTLYDPATTQDVMGYKDPSWTSDFNYEIARHFLELPGSFASPASPLASSADHLVVSGWMSPGGQVHLGPMARAFCKPVAAGGGPYQLALASASGTRTVAFDAAEIGCLPEGYRAFTFTVPAGEPLAGVEVRKGGSVLLSRRPTAALNAVGAAPVLEERDGILHVTWDAKAMPYVSIVHEGATRTTLALRLQGGSADLPLAGLPKGGHFTVQGGDGVNHRPAAAQARARE
jgi:hypothetical protein